MADGWLSTLLGIHRIKNALNVVFPQRSTLKVIGATVTDDPTNKQTVVDLTAGVNGNVTVRQNSGADVGTRPRLNLIEGAGIAITAGDDAINGEVDVTFDAQQKLYEVYNRDGLVDLTLGSNPLLLRAADNNPDVLLRFRRNSTDADGEQTILKAPDAIAAGVAGTSLHLDAGAGISGTGSADGSAAGSVELRGKTGGNAVNGQPGQDTTVRITAGDAGDVSGASGTPQSGGDLILRSGKGSDSSNSAVDGGGAGSVDIDTNAPGAGTGGEGGSADGARGTISLGADNAGALYLGNANAFAQLLGVTIQRGILSPIGNITGSPGDFYYRVGSTTNSGLWQHRGTSADNASWYRVADSGNALLLSGGTLTGALSFTPATQAFSATPTFDTSANSLHAFTGALTGNITNLTLSTPAVGRRGSIYYVQDGTGGRLIQAITCTGFTVLMKNATHINSDTTANRRFVLTYEMVDVGGTQVCVVQTQPALAVAYS